MNAQSTVPQTLWVLTQGALAHQPPVQWALSQVQNALAAQGITLEHTTVLSEIPPDGIGMLVADRGVELARTILHQTGAQLPAAPESMALVPAQIDSRRLLLACGADVRGLVYALLEVADQVIHAEDPSKSFRPDRVVTEQAANPIRSIARLFTSEVEDKVWFYDHEFWRRYLSMLVSQRFNRFSLTLGLGYNFPRHVRDAYFYFAYPFFLDVPGYQVRVPELADEERDRNLQMLQFISEETQRRGLHFQLALWTHAYAWVDSPDANYTIEGLTPETHANYCRDALYELLQACPAIDGVTFRVHGESGVPERSYDFWQTVFEGIVRCRRTVEIDMHAKGLDEALIEVALATGLPVNISPKYWAEHMGLPYHQAAIRELEHPQDTQNAFMSLSGGSRRFLRYGHGDLLREDRRFGVLYRIWPGTQRLLLWGDPAMAAGYGRLAHFCGNLGLEFCEPLSFKGRMGSGATEGRAGYAEPSLLPAEGDWAKYLYTYRLFGRLLYNPEAEPDVWQRFLHREFGPAAASAETALAHASRVLPLVTVAHHPSASNNAYWPEIYTNMPIVDEARSHPYGDTPSPKRFGTVSPLDPAIFSSIDECIAEFLEGKLSGRYSPIQVAAWLEGFCTAAEQALATARETVANAEAPSFRRWCIDIALQGGLGRFFAQKLRTGVWFALYQRTGERRALERALTLYRDARCAWANLAALADEVYVQDLTFGLSRHLRGCWLDRLPAIDADIQDMEQLLVQESTCSADVSLSSRLSELMGAGIPATSIGEHTPPASFQRARPLVIELQTGSEVSISVIRLHYRHVNQAERYTVADMLPQDDGLYRATIPESYTNSDYPLQYYMEMHDDQGHAWLHPGFEPDLANQPYYVVRRSD